MSKRSKGSGSSFRKAKEARLLSDSATDNNKITTFFKREQTQNEDDDANLAADSDSKDIAATAPAPAPPPIDHFHIDDNAASAFDDVGLLGQRCELHSVESGHGGHSGDSGQQPEVQVSPDVTLYSELYDIGLYISNQAEISDTVEMVLLDHHLCPSNTYLMPHFVRIINGKAEKRYLRHEHLQKYPFLSLSPSQKRLYCRPCVLFGPASGTAGQGGGRKLKTLVTEPLIKYDRMFGDNGYVTTHVANDYHKTAILCASLFRQSMITNNDIVKQVDVNKTAQANANRSLLRPIIKTILFCGRQNLPLQRAS